MSASALSRPGSQLRVSLPEIKHPLSALASPAAMDVRGVASRASLQRPLSNPPLTGRPLANEGNYSARKSISAGRVSARGSVKDPLNAAPIPIEAIPEGVEVTYGDPAATRLPVFGSGVGRDAVSRASSRASHASTAARIEVDEIEAHLKERLKTSYYDVRKKFKDNDPEGRGNVSREAFTRILVTVLGRGISAPTCQRLMERLGFAERQVIPFTEFFSYFREAQDSSYPQWMDPVHRANQDRVVMNMTQVHANLREKAKQRFLDLADMIPQMNPGGSGRVMKGEFRQMLNRMQFYMDDQEFDKLWRRYDPANEGVINGQKLLSALGIEWRQGSRGVTPFQDGGPSFRVTPPAQAGKGSVRLTPIEDEIAKTERSERRTPRKKEVERRQQLNIENWLKNKFREGFFAMREAFEDNDPSKSGVVSFDKFCETLGNFGLKMEKPLLGAFLSRCSVKAVAGGVPYREFLHRFQDRGDEGMTHNVLTDVKHRYNNDGRGSPSVQSTLSAVETQLTNMFQRDFLALLGMFKKIDHLGTDVVSQEEFRAAIESRFNMELTDGQFAAFIDRVPLDVDGAVQYAKFMQQFDAGNRKAASLFGPKPDQVDPDAAPPVPLPSSPQADQENVLPSALMADVGAEELHRRRNAQELFRVVKDLLSRRFQEVEERFYAIDETNTRRISQDTMYELLRGFDVTPEISRGEIRDLWRTFITNTDRTLDYLQFVRHFGFSPKSAVFPNAKLQPPRRGDADFMVRSRKLNCAADMLQDNLRAKVDYLWDDLRREFVAMDPYSTGLVQKEEFREVLTELCVNLSNLELEQLISKFDIKKDGRVSYIEFLKPFALRKQTWRHGNNMLSLLQHPQPELPIADIVEPPQRGLHGITAKLRTKLAGDWKNLRRAFRKLDVTGTGLLSLPEFRSVLKLANVVLDEDEVYHVMNEFDRDLTGKISYDKFIEETFKPETRQSARK